MSINTENIASLLKEQISKFDSSIDVSEVGEVIDVGDGVARVSGLENVMSSELVELPNGIYGMALNLEEDTDSLCPNLALYISRALCIISLAS